MLSILDEIQKAKGKQKQVVLKQYNESVVFKKYLVLAYNPYLRYGIQKTTYPNTIPGNISLNWQSALNIVQSEDRVEILKFINTVVSKCKEKDQIAFKRLILKDLRCGINIRTINTVFPKLIPEFKLMLAKKVNWNRVKYPCWADIKLDGVRCVVTGDSILTRSGRPIIGCDHILEAVNNHMVMCPNTAIDGELMVKDMYFDQASGNIRALSESPNAVFYMFDIAYLDGRPQTSFEHRLELIKELSHQEDYLKLCPRKLVKDSNEAIAYYSKSVQEGFEGIILKPLEYRYERKRSYHWMKVKPTITKDLRCIGFYEGEGRFEGTLGGIIVQFGKVEVHVGGGFSDLERDEIWNNKDKYLGERAEIKGQEKTLAGSIRHPQFKQWRHDK